MNDYATTIYVISDEILRVLRIDDDSQSQMSNAEVITFAVLSAKFFYSHFKKAGFFCKELKLFKKILSNSRLNRRIHAIPWHVWNAIFRYLSLLFVKQNPQDEYIVDSFPVSCCEKITLDTHLQKSDIFVELKFT